ncbi:RNA/RNP complex-1-interacting phosphatase-like [Mytilus edulis]|uniref:RNA/RNP complex-1-interacting phosphatase-like n=1 Tax=Mytilus edulis TaxID=6550 RepID=UPI0039EEDF07
MPPPDRWEKYGSLGEVISGTKFVAFKVPLKKELLSTVHEKERFGPEDVIEKLKDKGKELGLVIDITYTDKYYHKGEFCRKNVEHEKIYTYGHVVPTDAVVYRFFDVVEKFIKRNNKEEMVIGVHCTHGVNRTGYIVCRYMVERLGIDPTEAMEAFKQARGHPIERQNYIDDLLTRKHNPDYVIGDHPPVLKAENANKSKKDNSDRYKPWLRHKKHDKTQSSAAEVEEDKQYQNDFQTLQLNNSHAFNESHQRGYHSYDRTNNYGGERSSGYNRQNNYGGERSSGYDRQRNYGGERSSSYDRRNNYGRERSHNDSHYHNRREELKPYHRTFKSSRSYPPIDDRSYGKDNSYSRTSRHNYNSQPNLHIHENKY